MWGMVIPLVVGFNLEKYVRKGLDQNGDKMIIGG
jgi:hypothetical protein